MAEPLKLFYQYLSFKNGPFRRYSSGKNKSIEAADSKSIEELVHGSYGALLFDKRWINRRSEILSKDGNKCVICFETESLQVHHRQYHFTQSDNKFKLPWEYPDNLMVTLCEKCHKRGHSIYKVPIIYI